MLIKVKGQINWTISSKELEEKGKYGKVQKCKVYTAEDDIFGLKFEDRDYFKLQLNCIEQVDSAFNSLLKYGEMNSFLKEHAFAIKERLEKNKSYTFYLPTKFVGEK